MEWDYPWLRISLLFILWLVCCSEQVIAGLDRAVATMLKGEISQITVKPEYGFGTDLVESAGTNVSAHSTLVYEVELVDFTKVMTKLSRR